MTYTILFVAALILVSGFIAYFGDLLGRKMGKKRLTLFNMRPRYTAIVVTTITGMLISALALVLFLSINSEFRKAFTQGELILEKNRQLLKSNMGLIGKNKSLMDLSEMLRKEVAKQQIEVAKAHKDAQNALLARNKAVASVERLEKDIAAKLRELSDLRKRSDIAESDLKKRTQELKLVRVDLSNARESLNYAQAKLGETQIELAKAEETLVKQKQALVALNSEHERIVALSEQGSELAVMLRWSDLTLRQGDEITRGIISPKQSDFGIRGDLFSLLDEAGQKVSKLRAKIGENGRATKLIYKQKVDNSNAVFIDDEVKCIDMATEKIASIAKDSGDTKDVLVQVVTAMNTMPDEQVYVELRLYVNKLVYSKGDKIADAKVDGKLSEGRILLSVIDFLQKQVSEAALNEGIVPISNPDTRSLLGRNPLDQIEGLMSVVADIKNINGLTNLSAYADSEIYAVDRLNMKNMRFSVKKAD